MPRPCLCRKIGLCPKWNRFAPTDAQNQPIEEIVLTLDEVEAIRLADLQGLYQEQAARKMNISRQTLGNIINAAHRKLADFLINGKSLTIHGGNVKMMKRQFQCDDCRHEWDVPCGTPRPMECPACQSPNLHRSINDRGPMRQHQCRRGHGQCRRNTSERSSQ